MAVRVKKGDMISAISDKSGCSKKDAEACFVATFEFIAEQLAAGNEVPIPEFGTFKLSKRAERVGRNPQTKETITIAASVTPAFKCSSVLKNTVSSAQG